MIVEHPTGKPDVLVCPGTYCIKMETSLKDIVVDPNAETIPFPKDALSDHLPRFFIDEKMGKFVTFNCLNPRWLKYLFRTPDNEGQRLWDNNFANPTKQKERMTSIVHLVVEWIKADYVVCLQEVCPDLKSAISDALEAADISFEGVMTCVNMCKDDSGETEWNNCNLTIFKEENYRTGYQETLSDGRDVDDKEVRAPLTVIQMRRNMGDKEEYSFDLMNVHLSYKYIPVVIDIIKNFQTNVPMIICGDFNMSSRFIRDGKKQDPIRQMSQFQEGCKMPFLLPLPYSDVNNKFAAMSHSNCAKNTGMDATLQPDCFDHFLVANQLL
jgi:hypothetical protein